MNAGSHPPSEGNQGLATPTATIQGMGQALGGVREARRRSPVARIGALLLLLIPAVTGGVLLWNALQRPLSTDLLMPMALLLLAGGLAWRWYR